jgi:NhaP-type Na+/H+ or K+/H+ antiporter
VPAAAARGLELADPYAVALLFVGLALFVAIGALSHEHDRAWSAAVVYLALGAVAALGLWVLGVDPLDPLEDAIVVERVTELALIVAIFAAGLSIERQITRRQWGSVALLLLFVMPATIALVAVFATQALGLSLGAAIVLGAILAPTDPVLAGDVGLGAPGEHEDSGEPNFSLHTEAGLNDGLAFPAVMLGLWIAAEGGTGWVAEWVAADVVYGLLVAGAAGALGGTAIAAAIVRLRERRFLAHDFDAFVAVASVLVVYGLTEAVGAYGFVAVFVAGFAFRRYEFHHEVNRRIHDGADHYGKLLELAVILGVGSALTLDRLGEPGLAGWLLAPLLLFVIRPLLVIPFADRRIMRRRERWFLGWFGVRGVAAFYYAAYVVQQDVLAPAEAATVFWTATAVVIVSLVLHGVTAAPLTKRWLDPST